jgi:hypothetical protein
VDRPHLHLAPGPLHPLVVQELAIRVTIARAAAAVLDRTNPDVRSGRVDKKVDRMLVNMVQAWRDAIVSLMTGVRGVVGIEEGKGRVETREIGIEIGAETGMAMGIEIVRRAESGIEKGNVIETATATGAMTRTATARKLEVNRVALIPLLLMMIVSLQHVLTQGIAMAMLALKNCSESGAAQLRMMYVTFVRRRIYKI